MEREQKFNKIVSEFLNQLFSKLFKSANFLMLGNILVLSTFIKKRKNK